MVSASGPFPILTGPTGIGKTTCSLKLAEDLNAEIISADSRQIYRELTIGSAKPTTIERAGVPHHFIDEKNLGDIFSAGSFAKEANQRIQTILERGRIPLIVGGSTLYLHALQFGLAAIPPTNSILRKQLENRLVLEGADHLYQDLKRVDPVTAALLDVTKTSRLIRALGIYYSTGKPQSWYYSTHNSPLPTLTKLSYCTLIVMCSTRKSIPEWMQCLNRDCLMKCVVF